MVASFDAASPGREQLVRGHGLFLDDLDIAGTLSCHFVRSVIAHGVITSIEIGLAARRRGVHAVLLSSDLALEDIPGKLRHGPSAPEMGRPPLVNDRVRYVGEPFALVVADTPTLAADAADSVFADFETLPAVIDPVESQSGRVLLFPEAGTNVVDSSSTGESREGHWPIKAAIEVTNQRLAPLTLEPLGILVEPTGDGLHIWCGHQAPHRLRSQLAAMLGLPEKQIRVTVPNVGGGFGARGMFYPEYLVVAAAAIRLNAPLKWVATRREDFTGGIHGRAQTHRIRLEGEQDGRIKRARVEILADLGAYPHNGSLIPGFTRFMATGPYLIDEVSTQTTMVVTNTAPIGTYRGAGRPEAAYALERAIEAFARECGLDSIEVRRRNLIPPSSLPMTAPSGAEYDSGDYPAALDALLAEVDVDAVRDEQRRRAHTGEAVLGLGIAMYLERAGGPLTEGEYASVAIGHAGTLTVRVGAVDTGQGHDEIWTEIAGAPFGLSGSGIAVVSGDTDLVPEGVGTFASRSTQICGSVVARCSTSLFERARDVAAEMLEVDPADLVAREGRFETIDRSGVSVGLDDVSARAVQTGVELHCEELWVPGAHTFPYGAHAAIVEVDRETGDVQLLRAVAVDDCGTVLSPSGVTAQIHGSLAQGIGQARFERVHYDDQGQPLTTTLVDYLAPRASDLPFFQTAHLVTPAPSNVLGAKGVGESGCIGFPPAMVNAAVDAVSHLGVTEIQMPVDPCNVWTTIRQATPAHAKLESTPR